MTSYTITGPAQRLGPVTTHRTVPIDLAEYLDLERAIFAEIDDPGLSVLHALSAYPAYQHAEITRLLATDPSTGPFAESSMELPDES